MKNGNLLQTLSEGLSESKIKKNEVSDFCWLLEHPDYEFRPVDVKTFITSKNYLDAADETWESIISEMEKIYKEHKTDVILEKGIGSGKSHESSLITTYEIFNLLCLKNPAKFLGVSRGSKIAFMNMGINATQAHDIVFSQVLARIAHSPWFQRHAPPDPSIKSVLRFKKNIYVIPGNSKESFPLGYDIFGATIDDASWYTETERHDVAKEMIDTLKRRVTSRFGYRGKVIVLTNPRYENDFVQKRIKKFKNSKNFFIARKTLFEMKPEKSWGSKRFWFNTLDKKISTSEKTGENWVAIPFEFYDEWIENPEKCLRDYLAIPSGAIEPYFTDKKAIEDFFKTDLDNCFTLDGLISKDTKCKHNYDCVVHIDLSKNRDSCGIAIGHRVKDDLIFDGLCNIDPPQGEGEIQFYEIRNRIYNLKDHGFRIRKITMDGWQSVDSIQEFKRKGYEADTLSIDRTLEPYDTFKGLVYERRATGPVHEKAKSEMARLEFLQGKKVDHAPNWSKDIADCLAGISYNLFGENKREVVKPATNDTVNQIIQGAELESTKFSE